MVDRGRVAASLSALAMLAICCLVVAARSGAALCTRRVALPMPGGMAMDGMAMDGMTMPPEHGLMLCPIVLWLIAASIALSAAAIVIAACDPHRRATGQRTIRAIARLNVTRCSGMLGLGAIAAGIAMEFLDAGSAATPASRLLLIAIALGGSLVLTLLAQVLGRIALALCSRVWYALSNAIIVRTGTRPCYTSRGAGSTIGVSGRHHFSRAHGLRAPPPALWSANTPYFH